MKLFKNPNQDKKNYSMNWKNFAVLATAILLTVQTSCVNNSKTKKPNYNIYQPSTLRLQKDQPIQTVDGIYTPQTDEVWHSDKRYRVLEQEILFQK